MITAPGRLNTAQTPEELAQTNREASFFNKTINQGKELKKILNQEDFLNLLITELKNQDPTDPMKDRESIAQMAQFSSLEQMTNMARNIDSVTRLMARSEAYALLGRQVELGTGDRAVRGTVEEVVGGDAPQVLVNGLYYELADITRVTAAGAEKGE